MNIFEKVSNYFLERRLSKLENYLQLINKRYEFNPLKTHLPTSLLEQDLASKRLAENLTWFSASVKALREFYRTNVAGLNLDDGTYFWTKAPNKNRKVHSGIPNLISRKMATILFGRGFNIDINIYKEGQEENNVVDEKLSKKAKELMDEVLLKLAFNEKLKKAAISESWSGHIAFKLSHDIDLSPFPILEIADKRTFEVVKNRGITTAIIFKTYYKKDKKDFILHEIYTTAPREYVTKVDGVDVAVDKGTSMIIYKLYLKKANGDLEEVELSALPETAELPKEIIYYGLKGMLAFDKPNLIATGELADSIYGASDYQGAYSTFDSLDEIVSEIVAELREHKTIRYIPDVFLPIDSHGNVLKYDDFVTNYVITQERFNEQDYEPKINITQITDKTNQHYEKYKVFVAQACNICGLSPLSLGITGLESINSSDKSTRERAKTTIETRNDKLEIWKPFLTEVLVRIMEMTSWIQTKFPETIDDGIPKIDIDYSNCDVLVTFPDYVDDSTKERIEAWGPAKQYGVVSTEMAVRKIHGDDLSEADIIDEVNRIRYEQGMLFNTPDLLTLDGEEDIQDKVGGDDDDEDNQGNPSNKKKQPNPGTPKPNEV